MSGRPLFALKIALLGYIPNGVSIGSAVFAGLTIVTNTLTDRPTTLLRLR